MKVNEVLALIQETGAKISGREPSPDGDGWILYIGRLNELVYPFATLHCIPIHVPHLENPDLHTEEARAVLRRFLPHGTKRSGKSEKE